MQNEGVSRVGGGLKGLRGMLETFPQGLSSPLKAKHSMSKLKLRPPATTLSADSGARRGRRESGFEAKLRAVKEAGEFGEA